MVVKLPSSFHLLHYSYTPKPQCFEMMARSNTPLPNNTRPLARGEQPSGEETARNQKRKEASSSKGPTAIDTNKTTKKHTKGANKEYNLLPSNM